MTHDETLSPAFAAGVVANQAERRAAGLREFDYIVCGAGSSGSVVARRLAENPAVTVLLLEAGGDDVAASVSDPLLWQANLGGARDWGFVAEPSPHLNGRAMPLSMGKGLGGGSSINAMMWSRGHQTDWDHFAQETGDAGWGYQSVLGMYRRIEDWQGAPDPLRRGRGGLFPVETAKDPHPLATAMLHGAADVGIPTFADPNGAMMEGSGGAALCNVAIRGGTRSSIFRRYVYPVMAQPNLTVLTHALVTRILIERCQARGVEVLLDNQRIQVRARCETILSLGAINTPKLLLQSGVGDAAQLRRHGIALAEHLPGVGQNFQDHVMAAGCGWASPEPLVPRNNQCEATFFWKSDAQLDTPDIQAILVELPGGVQDPGAPLAESWKLLPGLVRPKSRGTITLTGCDPLQPIRIEAQALADPDDVAALVRGVTLCREIANGAAMAPFNRGEVAPGNLTGAALEAFVRESAATVWHQAGTAKMGRDAMSVVDAELRVYGIANLRIADASIMPRVTTGNTMAPCVVIGERLAMLMTATRVGARSGVHAHDGLPADEERSRPVEDALGRC
ncbi:GMC family oxidoreductase [Sphingomonas albertensis]|uniref:GMC family oxidoreductase N-terminal domain-containing protein n=1 Tax=Sphingomonas albertensis TaxID=2762591 RepID=A0ABR7AI12_9SPHN|nr:GMC family oxidoreductase N-terminal domain-containing protein [Sphingomonas albertensis]MBC3940090.1 GMC family oxidoreductase N-terminal domain-containing protein [Sphingomonas albertensis]